MGLEFSSIGFPYVARRCIRDYHSCRFTELLFKPNAKEFAVKTLFRFGVLAASMFLFLGCGPGAPESTEDETKELYESSEYENEMMDAMGGESGGAAPDAGGATPE